MAFPFSIGQVNVAFAIAGAIFCLYRQRTAATLQDVILKLVTASAIPTGVMLIVGAFNPELLKIVTDTGIYIAAGGVALLFVSIKELLK